MTSEKTFSVTLEATVCPVLIPQVFHTREFFVLDHGVASIFRSESQQLLRWRADSLEFQVFPRCGGFVTRHGWCNRRDRAILDDRAQLGFDHRPISV